MNSPTVTDKPAQTRVFQPLYVAYAQANGREPGAQLAHDETEYPGGCMRGFICWISSQLSLYRKAKPDSFLRSTLRNYNGFTQFLECAAHATAMAGTL